MKMSKTKKAVSAGVAGVLAVAGVMAPVSAMAYPEPETDTVIESDFDQISLSKTIHAPEVADTDGLTYTFDFQAAAPASQTDSVTTHDVDASGNEIWIAPDGTTEFVYDETASQGYAPDHKGEAGYERNFAPTDAGVTAKETTVTSSEVADGAFPVPSVTAAQIADPNIDTTGYTAGQQVDIPTITLVADAMSGNSQLKSDNLDLPDANLFGHAGVYAFTVKEAVSNYAPGDDAANWENDKSEFKIRLYVVNDTVTETTGYSDGTDTISVAEYEALDEGEKAGYTAVTSTRDILKYQSVTIEQIVSETGEAMSEKLEAFDFDNTYVATGDLEVKKLVSGDFANKTFDFTFTLELTFPSYIEADTEYHYTDADGVDRTITVGADHKATIENFNLSDFESFKFADLPVGTTYKLTETTPSEGVNNYKASIVYAYDGAEGARAGFTDLTNNTDKAIFAEGGAGQTQTWNKVDGAQNTRTAVGLGENNIATVTNTLDNPPSPTGVLVETLPFVLAVAVPVLLIAGAFAIGRKREED